jgi:hypothetical protein
MLYAINLMIGPVGASFKIEKEGTISEVRDTLLKECNNDTFVIDDHEGICHGFIPKSQPIIITVIPDEVFERRQSQARYAASLQGAPTGGRQI